MDDIKTNNNTDNNTDNNNNPNTPSIPNLNNVTDPDLIKLHQMTEDERLWFFIDDIIPTDKNDTEIIVIDEEADDGTPQFVLSPKSLEIFETIANAPNHAMSYYPNMIKYFQDIKELYNTIVIPDRNPYWVTQPIQNINPQALQMLIDIHAGNCQGYLSKNPVPNSVPYRLIYGDNTHEHDFVGIVYMYTK